MKPLTAPDQLFLWLDKRHQPMHVGGLQLFTPPPGAPDDFVRVVAERVKTFAIASPPFNRRLERKRGQYYWTEDTEFDIEHHLRHLALPKPGRIRELLALVSQLHAAHLDRSRPLWEFHLIEGMNDGRFAIYTKVHHSMMDGVAAARMMERSLSEDMAVDSVPIWAMTREKRTRAEHAMTGLLSNLAHNATEQVKTIPTVTREIYRALKSKKKDSDFVAFTQAPRSLLNRPITSSRRYAAQSYSLTRIKEVGKKTGATVNDVVLAMCASALRRYLLELSALPEEPLIAMVPVSLRKDDSAEGNQVALILANLATHLADPQARLDLIRRSVQNSKDRYSRMKPAEVLNYTAAMMAPAFVSWITGKVEKQAFNVVISNVSGPKVPLYWNGAKMEGSYPVSIVLDGQALNITLTSYIDELGFGVLACRRTLPHVQRLLPYLEDGLTELESIAGAL